jgi:hypothetical protein
MGDMVGVVAHDLGRDAEAIVSRWKRYEFAQQRSSGRVGLTIIPVRNERVRRSEREEVEPKRLELLHEVA